MQGRERNWERGKCVCARTLWKQDNCQILEFTVQLNNCKICSTILQCIAEVGSSNLLLRFVVLPVGSITNPRILFRHFHQDTSGDACTRWSYRWSGLLIFANIAWIMCAHSCTDRAGRIVRCRRSLQFKESRREKTKKRETKIRRDSKNGARTRCILAAGGLITLYCGIILTKRSSCRARNIFVRSNEYFRHFREILKLLLWMLEAYLNHETGPTNAQL